MNCSGRVQKRVAKADPATADLGRKKTAEEHEVQAHWDVFIKGHRSWGHHSIRNYSQRRSTAKWHSGGDGKEGRAWAFLTPGSRQILIKGKLKEETFPERHATQLDLIPRRPKTARLHERKPCPKKLSNINARPIGEIEKGHMSAFGLR